MRENNGNNRGMGKKNTDLHARIVEMLSARFAGRPDEVQIRATAQRLVDTTYDAAPGKLSTRAGYLLALLFLDVEASEGGGTKKAKRVLKRGERLAEKVTAFELARRQYRKKKKRSKSAYARAKAKSFVRKLERVAAKALGLDDSNQLTGAEVQA
jgi:hypothetical protein